MKPEEIAELVGCYFGLQQAGNMRPAPLSFEGANAINALRKMIDGKMQEIVAKLPLGTIDRWPRKF